ncbi:MAG: hypothetical protein ACOYBJ_03125 [Patescibacteria group bacterium]
MRFMNTPGAGERPVPTEMPVLPTPTEQGSPSEVNPTVTEQPATPERVPASAAVSGVGEQSTQSSAPVDASPPPMSSDVGASVPTITADPSGRLNAVELETWIGSETSGTK